MSTVRSLSGEKRTWRGRPISVANDPTADSFMTSPEGLCGATGMCQKRPRLYLCKGWNKILLTIR
jgi:hypothetical protein